MPYASSGSFATVTPEGWGVLAALFLVAVLLDYLIVRVGLDLARPASQYVFLVGRVGKIGALAAWCALFSLWWYPRYLGEPAPAMLVNMQWAGGVALALLSIALLPRAPKQTAEAAPTAARPGGIHA